MANAENFQDFVQANFDLLSDENDLHEVNLSDEVSKEVVEQINAMIAEKEGEESVQNEDSMDDFEEASKTVRHVSVNEEKLDYYSKKKKTRRVHNSKQSGLSKYSEVITSISLRFL